MKTQQEKEIRESLEEMFFDYHIRGCELVNEKANAVCDASKAQDIGSIMQIIQGVEKDMYLKIKNLLYEVMEDTNYSTSTKSIFKARLDVLLSPTPSQGGKE